MRKSVIQGCANLLGTSRLGLDFEIQFSVLIETFVTSISIRGTFKSFWDLTEVSEQSRHKVLTYELVNPTLKISLLNGLEDEGALLCFIDPRVRKIKNEVSSYPGIFSRTLRFYYVASSPRSPLPHLLD